MFKSILTVIAQYVATAIIFGVTQWVFNVVFDNSTEIDGGLIFQSIIFSILFVS